MNCSSTIYSYVSYTIHIELIFLMHFEGNVTCIYLLCTVFVLRTGFRQIRFQMLSIILQFRELEKQTIQKLCINIDIQLNHQIMKFSIVFPTWLSALCLALWRWFTSNFKSLMFASNFSIWNNEFSYSLIVISKPKFQLLLSFKLTPYLFSRVLAPKLSTDIFSLKLSLPNSEIVHQPVGLQVHINQTLKSYSSLE